MTTFNVRTLALLAVVLTTASGCSSHCSCPPPAPSQPTTVIQEPSR